MPAPLRIRRPLGLRIADGVMAALFVFSMALQTNDPDPVSWMAVYGCAALLSGALAAGHGRWQACAGLAAVAALWALWLLPSAASGAWLHVADSFRMEDRPDIEEPREVLGLAIVAAWMLVDALTARAHANATRSATPTLG